MVNKTKRILCLMMIIGSNYNVSFGVCVYNKSYGATSFAIYNSTSQIMENDWDSKYIQKWHDKCCSLFNRSCWFCFFSFLFPVICSTI